MGRSTYTSPGRPPAPSFGTTWRPTTTATGSSHNLETVWIREVEGILHLYDDEDLEGDVWGVGCAVSPDGNDVYLAGTVAADVAIRVDAEGSIDGAVDEEKRNGIARGGDDVFVASFSTGNGSLIFASQMGTASNDVLARGGGGISTDADGNAILMGTTRGSWMRTRQDKEGGGEEEVVEEGGADVFVLSVERGTGAHRPPQGGYPVERPTSPPEKSPPATTARSSPSEEGEDESHTAVGILGAVMLGLGATICLCAALYRADPYRSHRVTYPAVESTRRSKYREANDLSMEEGQCRGGSSFRTRGGSRRNARDKIQPYLAELRDIEVEMRKSATGGWHGLYDYGDACVAAWRITQRTTRGGAPPLSFARREVDNDEGARGAGGRGRVRDREEVDYVIPSFTEGRGDNYAPDLSLDTIEDDSDYNRTMDTSTLEDESAYNNDVRELFSEDDNGSALDVNSGFGIGSDYDGSSLALSSIGSIGPIFRPMPGGGPGDSVDGKNSEFDDIYGEDFSYA